MYQQRCHGYGSPLAEKGYRLPLACSALRHQRLTLGTRVVAWLKHHESVFRPRYCSVKVSIADDIHDGTFGCLDEDTCSTGGMWVTRYVCRPPRRSSLPRLCKTTRPRLNWRMMAIVRQPAAAREEAGERAAGARASHLIHRAWND
jgi:hypothetical protein